MRESQNIDEIQLDIQVKQDTKKTDNELKLDGMLEFDELLQTRDSSVSEIYRRETLQ